MIQKDVVYSIKHPDHEILEQFRIRIYLEALYAGKVYNEPFPYGGTIIHSSISRKPDEKEYNLEFRIIGGFNEEKFVFEDAVKNALKLIHEFKLNNFDSEEEI